MTTFDELKKWAWNKANIMINYGKSEIDRTQEEIKKEDSIILQECLLQLIIIYLKYLRKDCDKDICNIEMLKVEERFNKYERFKKAD